MLSSHTVRWTGIMACESISYHDTILGRVWERGGIGGMEVDVGGFAFATRLHREVKPESGLTLGNFRYVSMSYYDPLLGPGSRKRRRKGNGE